MIWVDEAIELLEWSDEYKIGDESIDNAHKQLFSVVNQILQNCMNRNYEQNEKNCTEAIRFLKDYAVKHFKEEEAFQLSVGYAGYKMHKKVHDDMRDIVIPALEKEVAVKGYSTEALEHFTGTIAGWLAAHILIEDQAITGKTKSKWINDPDNHSENLLEQIVETYIERLFRMQSSIISKKYAGYRLNKLFCYNDQYASSDGTVYSIVLAAEEPLLKRIAMNVVNEKLFSEKEIMLPMLTELLKSFISKVMTAFMPGGLTYIRGRTILPADFYSFFSVEYPKYSMLFQTNFGYMAFCIREKRVKGGKL